MMYEMNRDLCGNEIVASLICIEISMVMFRKSLQFRNCMLIISSDLNQTFIILFVLSLFYFFTGINSKIV